MYTTTPTPSDPPSRGSGKRRRSTSPQEGSPLEYASVEHLAKRLKHSSLSSSALAIISPTAPSTQRQYHFRQQSYATWCSAHQLNYPILAFPCEPYGASGKVQIAIE
ncbi:hypothetical protein RMATCC62417_13420 [Rhizopus microsporus]|nr:hypothetical protein RMATCC62417_13420 [Rhizopus microsporus]